MNKAYTVSEITQYIRKIITNDMILSSIYIVGEISNLRMHSSSHIYFTLKDEDAALKAVMFSNYTKTLKFVPKDGMKVIAYGYITVYEKAGQYQMTVSGLVPEGLGELYLAFEQLKEKLRLAGYFNEERKRRIPDFPEKVAIITSASGAALRDFINVATRRAKGIPIHVYDSPVQGEAAAAVIAERIRLINITKNADVIVIARGGGSIEDLWAFNDESLAKAILGSEIPVVTGIGHETDFTIADMVADLRAPTPSAAAEIIMPDMFSVSISIARQKEKAVMLMLSKLRSARAELDGVRHKNVLERPGIMLDKYRMELEGRVEKAASLFDSKLAFIRQRFEGTVSLLSKVNPLNILMKGYSYTTDMSGENIRSVDKISAGDTINVRFHDGECGARVKDVKRNG